MIFLTVGSAYPFDRLVKAVDDFIEQSIICEKVYAQIGKSGYTTRNMPSVPLLPIHNFNEHLQNADAVISHAGIGTILTCMELDKPLLVVPRRKRYSEIVADHQIDTARKYERSGLLLVAYEIEELPNKIEQLRTFRSNKEHRNREEIVEHIERFLAAREKLYGSVYANKSAYIN